MAVGSVFYSAAPTAPNSPELHFSYMNSFIQPSGVGSLTGAKQKGIEFGLNMRKKKSSTHTKIIFCLLSGTFRYLQYGTKKVPKKDRGAESQSLNFGTQKQGLANASNADSVNLT